MGTSVEKARKAARRVQEGFHYDGTFSIFAYEKVKDPETKATSMREVLKMSDVPCHLSRSSIPAASQTASAAGVEKEVKLFCNPDVSIPAGSKIAVTQAGVTENYKCSGVPAVYVTHQEITLELFERYA